MVITDEEIKEFDVNFGDVITDIQKKRKSKITNTLLGTNVDGDSIAAPINLSADMNSNVDGFKDNLNTLYSIDFEQKPKGNADYILEQFNQIEDKTVEGVGKPNGNI